MALANATYVYSNVEFMRWNLKNKTEVLTWISRDLVAGLFNKFSLEFDVQTETYNLSWRYSDSSVTQSISDGDYVALLGERFAGFSKAKFEELYPAAGGEENDTQGPNGPDGPDTPPSNPDDSGDSQWVFDTDTGNILTLTADKEIKGFIITGTGIIVGSNQYAHEIAVVDILAIATPTSVPIIGLGHYSAVTVSSSATTESVSTTYAKLVDNGDVRTIIYGEENSPVFELSFSAEANRLTVYLIDTDSSIFLASGSTVKITYTDNTEFTTTINGSGIRAFVNA
jgi:hypothetical protein